MAEASANCASMLDMQCYGYWLLCTLLFSSSFAIGSSNGLINQTTGQRLNHMVLHPSSGYIYVGAVNHLYLFDGDLSLDVDVDTGPRLDNPLCINQFGNRTCGDATTPIETTSTNNYNKILLLDLINDKVLSCGSIFQGTCQSYSSRLTAEQSYTNHPVYFVAANNEQSSTVAFINNDALYVGVTYTGGVGNSPIRSVVPILSSRQYSGHNIFKFTAEDDFTGSGTFLKKLFKDNYLISYVTGFGIGGFSYFLTTQKDESTETTKYISKIVQICQADNEFKSYVEMPLVCGTYNLVTSAVLAKPGKRLAETLNISVRESILIATFVRSQTPSSTDKGDESAICIYTVDNIRKMFTENLQNCFSRTQLKTGKHFVSSQDCTMSSDTVPLNYCGDKQQNSPLAGETALMSSPFMTFSAQPPLVAIAVEVVGDDHTVAFVATENGHLKKVLLTSNTQSKEFADLTIKEGSPINQDMAISNNRKHLYIMTEQHIFKVPVENCVTKTTCADCLADGDPYCGWCSLEKKCSNKNACADNSKINRWQNNQDMCIKIDDYSPKNASLHHPEMVTLHISNLPKSQSFKCVYKYTTDNLVIVTSDATVGGNDEEVKCLTPSGLRVGEGQDHLNVTLALRSMATKVDILDVPFALFSCSEHSKCSQCTASRFSCHWCLFDNLCRQESEDCTDNKGMIGSEQKESCPLLLEKGFLLPSGIQQDVQIKAKNLPNVKTYKCKLYKGSTQVAEAPASFTNSEEVVCQDFKYTFHGSDPFQIYSLRVHWNSNFSVDGFVNNVTVYNCSNMATDCTSCLVSPSNDFNCAWCQTVGCVYRESCAKPILEINKCPQAEILKVEPERFPIDGGTLVTITGSNIGQKEDDIKSVTLAGENCAVKDYETSIKIFCETKSVAAPKSGTISIEYMVDGKYLQEDITLYYEDPSLQSISPKGGPSSGKSVITITGEKLNTGKDVNILVGEIPCTVIKRTEKELKCVKKVMENNEYEITVIFDVAKRHLSGFSFAVYPDPTITSIEPLSSYKSGGRIVTITGTNLNTSEKPTLTLIKDNWSSEPMNCSKIGSTVLECPYPVLDKNVAHRRRRQTNSYSISLDIDDVPCVKNISSCFPSQSIQVAGYPDPVYDVFNGTKILEGKTLTLTGKDLNWACDEDEVIVMIGSQLCKVDSLKLEKLLCTPPEDWHKQATLPIIVKVKVGNLQYNLGKLELKDSVDQIVWIISSAVGGGTLIFIIIAVTIVYKRRSADVERQNKKLQIQLDTLESNVRNECKQAFAELQTEVSDFTSDLNVIGIPFWDYKMYTFRVLFPGLKTHPVLQTDADATMNKFGSYDQGLHQFNQLLNSKQFLLIFIRTLEQQKNFSIRDKSIVASLLMIVLQDKMEYATEILKALLNDLIDKSVEKKHPKLMLRRTESVVEKLLSNWLSLSMYTYLKKHAGKMLFMLFKAIKHQTVKGPVDVFTSEAKYSLSEDRLLREKVEPKTLTLQVVMNDMKEPVTFKALDCDTITQAKEKAIDAIFMNAPFSSRPSVYELDLEWRSGRSGHLPLLDEDVTTQVINGWKRVNSLAHYHVPDSATLVLVSSRNKNDMVRQVHGMIEITNSQSSLPPIVTIEEGTKVWHLVKHDDNQNVPRTQKVISEIFLTRLLATKGTLQQYIDDLFMMILRADNGLPPAVKYLFDFLDNAARRHNIVDSEVVHTWKSNSLPLRFWVNIIKNPEFIFDIQKSNIVDSCLSVIAQTFMDSCSTAEHRLGKDSPSNKLLFAKDIPRFRGWVSKFYESVKEMAPISDQEITQVMTEMSMTNFTDFNVAVALRDLYKYAMQYNFELLEALDDDPSAKRLHLANRFEQVQAVIEGTPLY